MNDERRKQLAFQMDYHKTYFDKDIMHDASMSLNAKQQSWALFLQRMKPMAAEYKAIDDAVERRAIQVDLMRDAELLRQMKRRQRRQVA